MLPIADFREAILDSVDRYQVTILTAETGAGKSTQVPQYLAEHGYRKVVVTQPRILAARNLSLRVREEWTARRGEAEGETVGYRTAHERDDTERTAILYCTDGLQLVREVAGQGVLEGQILVLDEIHEWNQNMEVLVAWARRRCQEEPLFKVLVMSATLDAERLADYFQAGPPIQVPGRSYPIAMSHGSDVIEEARRLLYAGGRNVLVFLPGKSEIERVSAALGREADRLGIPLIPLHGDLDAEAQQLAFVSYPRGKVILSTNIAQTSVTIEDIDAVVDSGLERRSEVENGVEGLVIGQASQADCLQRAGRAGRTKPGSYILAPLDNLPCEPLEARPPYAVPEILRTLLDRLVLRLAGAGIDIEDLKFFHQPDPEVIRHAKQVLVNLEAMASDGRVTERGMRMERYPVESRYARMLVEAEGLPDPARLKLAAVIAIQEVGGLVRGGTRYMGWSLYTDCRSSDLLAQYDLYLALPSIMPEEYEGLGIVARNVSRAQETFHHLTAELGLPELPLEPLAGEEERQLLRCIVAGQVDLLWVPGADGRARPVQGGLRREISGGTLVPPTGLLAGMPFNLEVPTPKGTQTLFLVQGLSQVSPSWLEELAPHFYHAKPGRLVYDPYRGCLAREWQVSYAGESVPGAAEPVRVHTPENEKHFASLLGEWVHGRLEEDRRRLQKRSRRRVAGVPLERVQGRLRPLVAGVISLEELDEGRRIQVERLTSLQAYDAGKSLSKKREPRRRR